MVQLKSTGWVNSAPAPTRQPSIRASTAIKNTTDLPLIFDRLNLTRSSLPHFAVIENLVEPVSELPAGYLEKLESLNEKSK